MPGKRDMTKAESRKRDRQLLDLLTHEILERKSRAARNIYDIGVRLARIQSDELYSAGGHPDFETYLENQIDISRTSAYRFMRIAAHFNARIVSRYGSDKLEAAISHMQATPEEERPGDLLASTIRLQGDDGRFFTKRMHDASGAEIREATALVREARRGGERIPRELQRRAGKLEAALPGAPKGLGGGDRVKLRRGSDGQLAVSFKDVPVEDIGGFLRVVKEWLD